MCCLTEHAGESPATQIWKSMLIRSESDDSLPSSLLPKLAHVLLQSFPGLLGASGSLKALHPIIHITTHSKGKVVHKRQPQRACVTTRSSGLPECVRAAIILIVCGEHP